MVPASVLSQWQNELYEKFNLNVPIYDGQKLLWRKTHGGVGPKERKVARAEWHKEPLVLCSSHLMRRRDRAGELIQAEDWDLMVLDEAHHARRRSPGSPQEGGPNRLAASSHAGPEGKSQVAHPPDRDANAGTPGGDLGSAQSARTPSAVGGPQRRFRPLLSARVEQPQPDGDGISGLDSRP